MKSFYEREDYDMTSIQQLIENEVEESIYLDFKEAGALGKENNIKKEISKDVASFANSDGGIIIYGIKEKEHKASELSFIDGNVFTKEWLEKVIESNIQRNIPDLKIFSVRFDGDISKTVYVVKIPASLEAPHISNDKRYYRRYNFQSHSMEEYEIRNLYNRKGTAKLEIDDIVLELTKYIETSAIYYFKVEVNIWNVGNIVETTYKLNLYLEKQHLIGSLSWDNTSDFNFTELDDKTIKVSALGIHPIFPTEVLTILRLDFQINSKMIPFDLILNTTLFYQNGEDTMAKVFDINKEFISQYNVNNSSK